MSKRRILLVRHCEVDERYKPLCYGQSDVELSELGIQNSAQLAHRLAAEMRGASMAKKFVHHSGLSRSRLLAETLAQLLGITAEVSHLLRERNYGAWELRCWEELYAETGDAMLGTIREPATWRPPGGETTFAMRDRVLSWYNALPADGFIVAVTHGGPIAALLGTKRGLSVDAWLRLIPTVGTITECDEF